MAETAEVAAPAVQAGSSAAQALRACRAEIARLNAERGAKTIRQKPLIEKVSAFEALKQERVNCRSLRAKIQAAALMGEPAESTTELDERIAQLDEQIDEYHDQVEAAQFAVDGLQQQIGQLNTAIASHEAQLPGLAQRSALEDTHARLAKLRDATEAYLTALAGIFRGAHLAQQLAQQHGSTDIRFVPVGRQALPLPQMIDSAEYEAALKALGQIDFGALLKRESLALLAELDAT